jgi:hypothetical protein
MDARRGGGDETYTPLRSLVSGRIVTLVTLAWTLVLVGIVAVGPLEITAYVVARHLGRAAFLILRLAVGGRY